MSKVQIYDEPMCCSTGVCGPQVDPVLPKFASDLEWLKSQGHQVDRFNLAQQPQEFAANDQIQQLLESEGVDCLPLILVDDRVVSRSEYPARENLALWTGSKLRPTGLPISQDGGCSGNSGCC
ncbi:MAG: arsenite efflux transporter metallochaperone ArsD [Planctomycetota bacterium]|nr:arsenite efflux transporter metallochaperone ArsD [Planctomycetota bacterium]